MDKNKIIIVILIIVAVILAAAMASMMLPSLNAQKDSKIAITSNKTLYEGDNLTVKLTDLNKTPIKKQFINVTIEDKDGKVVVNKSIKTDSKGKATFKLKLDAGKYTVNASFGGNENFTGNNTTKKITIKEEVVEQTPEPTQTVSEESSQSSSQQNIDDMDGDGKPDIFYSEYYNDDIGLVQYYDTRGGEHLEVYDDGSYYYQGADGSSEVGYI